MSRHNLTRSDRMAQMTKQEELIAKKRQELIEKQKTIELAKQVAAAQSNVNKNKKKEPGSKTVPTPLDPKGKLQNTFCNDGSFLSHFKKIIDSVKKEKEETPSEKSELNKTNASNQNNGNSTTEIQTQQVKTESQNNNVSQPSTAPFTTVNIPVETAMPPVAPTLSPPLPFNIPNTNGSYTPCSSSNANNLSIPSMPIPNANPTYQPPPYFNPCIPPPIMTVQPAPPPPPPPATPLYLIPPPEPLQLNNIPPPKELDLSAIPKPEMNLEAIKIPEKEKVFSDDNEQILPTTLESLVELVAEKGDAYEDIIRTRKNDVHSSLWFLFDKDSEMYANFKALVMERRSVKIKFESNDDKYDPESVCEYNEDSDEEYMKDMKIKNLDSLKRKLDEKSKNSEGSEDERERLAIKQRKRKSRWGEKVEENNDGSVAVVVQSNFANQNKPILSVIQRTDPALLQYARQNYGTINLSEDDWKKCEEHFKVNLLYQDMMRKRQEIDQLAKSGKFKYEYDSDEDVTGGTWEHKLRTAEMEATRAWADALTEQSEGKHHIGDFLPPEELKKFMEKYDAKKNNRQPDLSDYKEYKLREDNIGFQMLQKLGWKEGQGLGAGGSGIVDPVNKAPKRDANQGLGAVTSSAPDDCDNEYEAYRKRMMLAYRFRPNPLNNPRRAYY